MTPEPQPTPGPVPPQNLEAEEAVLGAMLISERAIDAAAPILDPHDFYRASNGHIYRAAIELYHRGEPVDVVTMINQLDRTPPPGSSSDKTMLAHIGGRQRIHELAALVPYTANAAHHARIIRDLSKRRRVIRAALMLQQAAHDGADVDELLNQTRRIADEQGDGELHPLTLAAALNEPIPDADEYIEGVLERGVLADIVGLPYLHKSAVALELATLVARGRGRFLGRYPVVKQARVAYFWNDDSRTQELRRIQDYADRHDLKTEPLTFYLNQAVAFPRDLPVVERAIRQHQYQLVIFDSLYNFTPGIDNVDPAHIVGLYSQLKRLCDEHEGLTIVLVDHAPKPTDATRSRHSSIASYGSIYKAAAVRATIVIERLGDNTITVTATGNNVPGFTRTTAYWDANRLELRLVDEPDTDDLQDLDELVLTHVRQHPGLSTNKIREGVGRNRDAVSASLHRLQNQALVLNTYGDTAALFPDPTDPLRPTAPEPNGAQSGAYPDTAPETPGRSKRHSAWIPLNHAETTAPEPNGAQSGAMHPGEPLPTTAPADPAAFPPKGGAGPGAVEEAAHEQDDDPFDAADTPPAIPDEELDYH